MARVDCSMQLFGSGLQCLKSDLGIGTGSGTTSNVLSQITIRPGSRVKLWHIAALSALGPIHSNQSPFSRHRKRSKIFLFTLVFLYRFHPSIGVFNRSSVCGTSEVFSGEFCMSLASQPSINIQYSHVGNEKVWHCLLPDIT